MTYTYEGKRRPGGADVTVDRTTHLPLRLDLRNHSPTGFEWGYGGSGPAQLALALCAHALGDDARALDVYQEFKERVLSRIPFSYWLMSSENVLKYVEEIEAERLARRADSAMLDAAMISAGAAIVEATSSQKPDAEPEPFSGGGESGGGGASGGWKDDDAPDSSIGGGSDQPEDL